MKSYEIVLIVDPSCSEQSDEMLARYQTTIEEKKGKIIRMENWGRRKLAYSIGKNHKAHFLFSNLISFEILKITICENSYRKYIGNGHGQWFIAF